MWTWKRLTCWFSCGRDLCLLCENSDCEWWPNFWCLNNIWDNLIKKTETKLRNCWVACTSRWWQGKDCEWAGFHDLGSRAGCRIWAHWVFWISFLLSDQDPPVMGTYRRLLLGVVPVCAIKRCVVGEGKKATLCGFQGEWELKRHIIISILLVY